MRAPTTLTDLAPRRPAAPSRRQAAPRRLLVTSDDAPAMPALQGALAAEGLLVEAAAHAAGITGRPARPGDGEFDAVLMWITGSLAGQLGRLRELRRVTPDLPLLVACKGLRDLDQVLALEMGADDVLDAAWSAPVVAARLRAHWRAGAAAAGADSLEDELHFGGLHLERCERRVAQHGAVVPLTEGEFEVLWLLASHAGHALTRGEILHRVRGLDNQPQDRSIDCRVYRIRAKLGDRDGRQHRIRTVRNRGYVFLPTGW
jgi:two-component system response regulator RstA